MHCYIHLHVSHPQCVIAQGFWAMWNIMHELKMSLTLNIYYRFVLDFVMAKVLKKCHKESFRNTISNDPHSLSHLCSRILPYTKSEEYVYWKWSVIVLSKYKTLFETWGKDQQSMRYYIYVSPSTHAPACGAVGNKRCHLWCQLTLNTAVPIIPVSAQEMSTMKNWWYFVECMKLVWLRILTCLIDYHEEKRYDLWMLRWMWSPLFFKLIHSATWQHLCFYPSVNNNKSRYWLRRHEVPLSAYPKVPDHFWPNFNQVMTGPLPKFWRLFPSLRCPAVDLKLS